MRKLFPQKNITHKNKVTVQEVYYSNDDVIVTYKDRLAHNVQLPIYHNRLLKPYNISIQSRYGHKNNPPFKNFIASDTDYLSSLIIFSNCDYATIDSIMVNYEATNIPNGTVKSRSGTDIASENA